jgi:hypothetical protein
MMLERVEVAKTNEKKTGRLPASGCLQFAMGMKVMVILNIATKADLTNGAQGEIIEIMLDHHEQQPPTNENGITKLAYPPAMIMFRPYHHTFKNLKRLPDGVIPIFPSQAKFTVHVADKLIKITRQMPAITASICIH